MGRVLNMKQVLSPAFYHRLVRPAWVNQKYIHSPLKKEFDLDGKQVLDFGSGTGANCCLFPPTNYIGVDPDHNRIMYSRKKYPEHAFHILDGPSLPVDDQSIDTILIISVLHHITSEELTSYVKDFKRILKSTGSIAVIEPCISPNKPLQNWFMKRMDKGSYIREEKEYFQFFIENGFTCKVINRFTKCLLYNELYFSVCPTT